MIRSEQIIKGLQILAKYPDNDIAAEHDIIYAGPVRSETISTKDAKELEELGWHIDSETDSWSKFV